MTRKEGYISFDLFKKIIDETKGYSNWVWLHQFGDPLLHPEIDKLTRYARKNGVKTRLSTNPQTMTPKVIERLMHSDLDFLHIALDGVDDKTYKLIRGKNADYDKAINSIENLLKAKKRHKKEMIVRMGLIKMKETEKSIDKFLRLWKRKGIDEIEVKNFLTWDGSDPEIMNLAEKAHLSNYFKSNRQRVCFKPWLHMVITWDGKVIPCCYDYDAKYILGDVNKQTLKEIWNSKRMQRFRKENLTNIYPQGHLCKTCREKMGTNLCLYDRFYPFNPFMLKKYWGRFINLFQRKTFLG